MAKLACDRMVRIRMTGVAAVCAALATGGLWAAGTTYYAAGGGTKNSFSYSWRSADNWRLDGANGTQIPETPPQEDDIVVFDKKIDNMSGAPDGDLLPALHKLVFNVGNTIHQGYICLKAGGEGLVMKDGVSMGWWAGCVSSGTARCRSTCLLAVTSTIRRACSAPPRRRWSKPMAESSRRQTRARTRTSRRRRFSGAARSVRA